MKKNFEGGQTFFGVFSVMNPLYEPILVFPKFDPLTAPGMDLCVDLAPKCQNVLWSLRLSGIEFSLVSD